MKTLKFIAIAATLTAVTLNAADKTPQLVKVNDADQFGGFLVKPAKGVVRFCDYQKKIQKRDMLGVFIASRECPIRLNFDHKAMEGAFDITKAVAAKGDANVAIFVVDDPVLPMTLVAVEEKWGLVNVAQISADQPKTLPFLRRAEKLFTRVATPLLGGCYDYLTPFSAMKPVHSVADLDKMDAKAIAPMSLSMITHTLPLLGLSQESPCTYEQACIEGWAPAPTNSVQKEIWNDVKNPANRFKKDLPELKK